MLHAHLYAPFANPLRQQLYEQVRAALEAEQDGPATLLLGNFAVETDAPALDAVVVRPHGITLLALVPGGGRLHMPALGYGAWQLEGQALGGVGEADNPFEQFRQQKEGLAAWLAPQLSPDQANLQFISGVVVFSDPVDFGPEVEEQLTQQPGGHFQLLGDATQLPRRLKQLAKPEIDLSEEEITQWAQELTEEPASTGSIPPAGPETNPAADAPASPWRKVWRWLGADDIPDDAPYGGYPAAQVAASSAEKERLEQARLDGQEQLHQKLQDLEAREAQRERSMSQLVAQLAQAPPVTSEAQQLREQLALETREKEALDEAIRQSRAESAARNQDLDSKIQQLGQLIEQLHARPAAAATAPASAAATAPRTASRSLAPAAAMAYRRARLWGRGLPRVAVVLGVVGLLGVSVWGASHLGGSEPVPYQENGKWGLADASGEPVVPAKYSSVSPFQQERAVVEENGAYGLVDADGKEVVAPAYDALNPYKEQYARVRVGDAYTFLDAEGQEFADYYFNALDFSEGLAAVLDNRGWHYIGGPEPEDLAKPPVLFQEAYSFRDGLARVRLADGFTFITKAYLQDPSAGTSPFGRYEAATDFENGKARVTQQGRNFTIDTDGDAVE